MKIDFAKRGTRLFYALLTAFAAGTCTSCSLQPNFPAPPSLQKANASIDPSFEPLPEPEHADNPRIRLGLDLFKETKLSSDNSISCISCHDINRGGSDSRSISVGIKGRKGTANAPTVFNSALNFRQFWNGRAASLAEQIDGPINNPLEMGSSWDEVIRKLNADPGYAKKFLEAFGEAANQKNITAAIVQFEQTLITPNSPFDRFLRGESTALSEPQLKGYRKFRAYGCVACHQGINIGGNMYQTMGVMGDYFKVRGGSFPSDEGLFQLTHNPSDLHVFRVPSLRNVELTSPYFHDGQVARLEDAVKTMGKFQLGRELSTEDTNDITQFLRSLTGDSPSILTAPQREKSGSAKQ